MELDIDIDRVEFDTTPFAYTLPGTLTYDDLCGDDLSFLLEPCDNNGGHANKTKEAAPVVSISTRHELVLLDEAMIDNTLVQFRSISRDTSVDEIERVEQIFLQLENRLGSLDTREVGARDQLRDAPEIMKYKAKIAKLRLQSKRHTLSALLGIVDADAFVYHHDTDEFKGSITRQREWCAEQSKASVVRLPLHVHVILRKWADKNPCRLNLSLDEKQWIANLTNLEVFQVTNWFNKERPRRVSFAQEQQKPYRLCVPTVDGSFISI